MHEATKHEWAWKPKGPARRLTGEEVAQLVFGENAGLSERVMSSLIENAERRVTELIFGPASRVIAISKVTQ